MFKKPGFLIFLSAVMTLGLHAQPDSMFGIKKQDTIRRVRLVKTEEPSASIIIQANHGFYLSLDRNRNSDKVPKGSSRKIKLKAGVHKLVLEEADSTGETIQRFIRVTPEMMKRSDSVYTVTFKNDYADLLPPAATATAKTEDNTGLHQREAKDRGIATELLNDMILKSGGSFKTISRGEGKEQAPQTVTVRSLNVGRHEVTQRQWQTVMDYNNSFVQNCPDCPVENVSWNEIGSFIEKLNKAGSQKFRLPTEAEWEYVAKKSIEEEEGSSVDPEEARIKFQTVIKNSAWYNEKTTHPVGRKKPVAGVFDLLGNVAEWCAGDGEKKISKGGSYKDKEDALRISLQGTAAATDKQRTVGFRLVADAD